jgi:hypothetical protein
MFQGCSIMWSALKGQGTLVALKDHTGVRGDGNGLYNPHLQKETIMFLLHHRSILVMLMLALGIGLNWSPKDGRVIIENHQPKLEGDLLWTHLPEECVFRGQGTVWQ